MGNYGKVINSSDFFTTYQTPIMIGGVVLLVVSIILIISLWKIFKKGNEKGYKAIIPFYNILTLMKIVGMNRVLFILFFIPIVNVFFFAYLSVTLANRFRKGAFFALGLLFLPFLFYPILAFGKAMPIFEEEEEEEEKEEECIICKNCGTKLAKDAKVCFVCQKPVEEEEEEKTEEPVEEDSAKEEPVIPETLPEEKESLSLEEPVEKKEEENVSAEIPEPEVSEMVDFSSFEEKQEIPKPIEPEKTPETVWSFESEKNEPTFEKKEEPILGIEKEVTKEYTQENNLELQNILAELEKKKQEIDEKPIESLDIPEPKKEEVHKEDIGLESILKVEEKKEENLYTPSPEPVKEPYHEKTFRSSSKTLDEILKINQDLYSHPKEEEKKPAEEEIEVLDFDTVEPEPPKEEEKPKETVKVCPNCGSKVPSYSNYCIFCGEEVK